MGERHLCPVCLGRGQERFWAKDPDPPSPRPCHGCGGFGWILLGIGIQEPHPEDKLEPLIDIDVNLQPKTTRRMKLMETSNSLILTLYRHWSKLYRWGKPLDMFNSFREPTTLTVNAFRTWLNDLQHVEPSEYAPYERRMLDEFYKEDKENE